ncbi:MAG: hypothetical protein BJ554DRAFT_1804, partial [Olpidium bornovanus]
GGGGGRGGGGEAADSRRKQNRPPPNPHPALRPTPLPLRRGTQRTTSIMSESRTELLAWLNDLLKTNYTKVEQCGTGTRERTAPGFGGRAEASPVAKKALKNSITGAQLTAGCLVRLGTWENAATSLAASRPDGVRVLADDVHLAKVKFDAKLQYEYVQNFKVLQSAFTAHKIDKVLWKRSWRKCELCDRSAASPNSLRLGCALTRTVFAYDPKIIPVERLIQCKFQDNLEFLQWMKKFWDSTFPGGHYDAEARRKGKAAGGGVSLTGAPRKPVGGSAGMDKAPRHPAGELGNPDIGFPYTEERDIRKSNTAAAAPQKIARRAAEDASPATVDAYEKKISDLEIAVAGLQKERDFYFEKLRGIEILTQQELEGDAGPGGRNGADVGTVLKEIQDVLYSTEVS